MDCNVDGIKINYVMEGQGDYVFVLHGWGCCVDTYKLIINILKRKYTVVAFDFPGFGKSQDPPRGWTMGDYTDFTIAFIRQFGCSKVNLIGHSFGTRIMIRMANERGLPFEIERMVFIDGAGILSDQVENYLAGYYKFKKAQKKLIQKNETEKLAELQEQAEGDYAFLNDVMSECYINAVTDDLEHMLPNIRVPTLLIWGENDQDTPLRDGKTMERLIPDSGLVVLENAGHYSFLDQPYIFKRVMESFFEI